MLATHLDPDTDLASRKPDVIDRTVDWVCTLLPRGAELLDIGCGPGLYTSRFARRGLRVTGLDFSGRSIAWAREHDTGSTYILMDYLEMAFDSQFDMITLIWCDYGALIPEDRRKLLDNIRHALKPGGLFLFDVATQRRYEGFAESTAWEACGNGGFWSTSPYICLSAQYCYEGRIGVSRYVILEDENVRCFNIWDTGFTKESLEEELRLGGFDPVACYADAEGRAYNGNSPTLCALARKAS